MGACRNACQYVYDPRIHLAGIRLARHRITFRKAHFFRNHRVYLIDGFLIPVKKLQKRSLRSRGSLRAQKFHMGKHMLQILQIKEELLQPKRRPLSHSSWLRRLEMGKSKRWLRLVFLRKIGKFLHHIHQFLFHQAERLRHHDDIRVVTHIAGCGTQMDDTFRFRTLYPVCIHMTHDIMADFLLPRLCHIVINILRICF